MLIGAVVVVPTATSPAATTAEIARLIEQLRNGATQTQASLALVDIGLPAVKPLIDGVCTKGLERWSHDTLLRLAMAARDGGGPTLDRGKIVAALIQTAEKDPRTAARALAIRMLGLVGRDESVPALAAALKDKALRADAIASLQQIPDPSAATALVDYVKAVSTADRCSVLHSLGLRGCKASIDCLTAAARDQDVNVQMAAVEGLGRAGDLRALPVVQAIAGTGAPQVRPVAMAAWLRLAEVAVKRDKPDQALAIYDKALDLAKTPLNRAATIAGYARVAGAAGTTRLIQALGKLGDRADRQILGVLARMPGEDVTRAIVGACKGAPASTRAQLVTALGLRRDPVGFDALMTAGKDADEEVRGRALRAMALVGEAEMDAAILEALDHGTPRMQAAAAGAYLVVARRLMRQDRAKHEAQVLEVYHRLLAKQVDDATRVAALEGIAAIASPASVRVVETLLTAGNAKVRDAAGGAYLAIAGRMTAEKDRAKARTMYNRLIDANLVPPGEMQTVINRLRALGDTSNLAGRLGMITHWWVIGPWPSPDYKAYDQELPPEKGVDLAKTCKVGERELKWQPVVTEHPEGRVDLRAPLEPDQNTVAYGYAEVTSDRDQDVVFRTGSDDGMKLWVNGKVVFGKNGPRSLAVDMDAAPARLKKGVNRVLVKVLNGSGAWEFCARVTTQDGRPVKLAVRPAK